MLLCLNVLKLRCQQWFYKFNHIYSYEKHIRVRTEATVCIYYSPERCYHYYLNYYNINNNGIFFPGQRIRIPVKTEGTYKCLVQGNGMNNYLFSGLINTTCTCIHNKINYSSLVCCFS